MNFAKILATAAVVLVSTGCAVRVVPVGAGVNQQYPAGTPVYVNCPPGGQPINHNNQPLCRMPNGQWAQPISVTPINIGYNQQYGNSNQGQVRGYAGTVPADINGRCPAGMVSSPRMPGQLPGCW